MINTVNTLGLNVIITKPQPYMNDTSVNSTIEVQFNSDLDSKTIHGNVLLLADKDGIYDGSGKLYDLSKYTAVDCIITYKDKVVYMTPREQLNKSTKYLIYVRPYSVKDILGGQMQVQYISTFLTESLDRKPRPNIVSPIFGSIHPTVPKFEWEDQYVLGYTLQVSKSSTFEVLFIDENILKPQDASYAPNFFVYTNSFANGLYYWRVKATNGDWCEPSQFFVRQYEDTPVSHEDTPYMDIVEEEQELEVLEVFPEEGFSNVGTNLKAIYLKVSGIVKPTDLDLRGSYVEGELSDNDDYDTLVPHGEMKGTWEVVSVEDENISYIIFFPDEL